MSELRTTIEAVLKGVHIETGRTDQWYEVVDELVSEISKKLLSHEIDYYDAEPPTA